jgi:hypothetical protein
MVQEGEVSLAQEYITVLRLDPSLCHVSEADVAAADAERAAKYLQLSLPPSAVLFVDSEEQLGAVRTLLEGASVLGMDCEWGACHSGGQQPCVSIFQVYPPT